MKVGDRVYYIISGRAIRPAIVKEIVGNRCVLKYGSGWEAGAVCLPASRVYESEEEAKKHLIPPNAPEEDTRGYPSMYMRRRAEYDFSGKPDP